MKKFAILAIALVAAAAIVGNAGAVTSTYDVNMCGASAQAGFWEGTGSAVVQDTYNCASSALDWETGNDKNLIIRGVDCEIDGDNQSDDIIYVRYLASNSDGGCTGYDCDDMAYVDPASCEWNPVDEGTCETTVDLPCQLGCADVPCDTLCAQTIGWEDGRSEWEAIVGPKIPSVFAGSCTSISANAEVFQGVVVPFGFIVNNDVTHNVCDYSAIEADIAGRPAAAHWAYNKAGWQCDPNEVDALSCRGEYKCFDIDEDGTAECADGFQGTAQETECSDASDCQEAATLPTCVEQPLDNMSRLMALHIFSNQVDNWNDFGPSFPNLPIVKCMRHGGSGTHQTLIDTVLRGDVTLQTITVPGVAWHYKSSSDLTRDCVAYYDGGVGYVDADKVMFRSGISDGVHQLKYQGAAPSRYDVASGKYNFWASQVCFMDENLTCLDATDAQILRDIQNNAANPAYLTFDNFGQRAYFWATQGEMLVQKSNGDPKVYPASVTPRP